MAHGMQWGPTGGTVGAGTVAAVDAVPREYHEFLTTSNFHVQVIEKLFIILCYQEPLHFLMLTLCSQVCRTQVIS